MTKKDYIKLAKLIKENQDRVILEDGDERGSHVIFWRPFVEELSAMLRIDNPLFDREKFIAACDY